MILKLNKMETEHRYLDVGIVVSLASFEKTCSVEKWKMLLGCKELESLNDGEVEAIINTNTHNYSSLRKTFLITYK